MRRVVGMVAERWLTIGFATLSAVLLYSAVNGERGLKHVFRLEADLADANDRNFRLVQGISSLRDQLRRIRTDNGALELVARRRLSLVRRDETLYRILTPRTPTPSR